jgi:N-acetylglucosamine malate deacetylase 1
VVGGAVRRLVVAPHADDEALGCGGLLAKFGPECGVVVLAERTREREDALLRAQKVLGYDWLDCMDVPDGHLQEHAAFLVASLDRLLWQVRPDEVYLPFPSMHQDHAAAYEAGVRAARLSMSADHWFPPMVLVYDIAVYDVNLYPTDLRWNVFEPLAAEHVALKSEACHAYDTEVPDGPHPINGVWQQAASVGHARQLEFAEQFALVRGVR